jgi:hypothetical protein
MKVVLGGKAGMRTLNLSNPDDVSVAVTAERQAAIEKFRTRFAIAVEQWPRALYRNLLREKAAALKQLDELVTQAIAEGSRAGLVWVVLSGNEKTDFDAIIRELIEQAKADARALLNAVLDEVCSGAPV